MKNPFSADDVIRLLESKGPIDSGTKKLWEEGVIPVANRAWERGTTGEPLNPVDYIAVFKEFAGEDPSAELIKWFKELARYEKAVYETGKRYMPGVCVRKGGAWA